MQKPPRRRGKVFTPPPPPPTHTHTHTPLPQVSTNGNLMIALSYDTIGNYLEGVVLKATALPKRNLLGLSGDLM